MMERTLDWRPHFDERSMLFRFAAIDCYRNGLERANVRRTKSIWLNQGREGACTGFGAEHCRALSPYPQATSDAIAQSVYHRARYLDEWPGEDYEGSSVNGAMKAEREMGVITGWRWAPTMAEARHGVSFHGAGEFGLWWYTGMFDADSSGFIHPTGIKEGGHALAYAGYKRLNGSRAHRLENSWGPGWGDNGGCWIWEQDLADLLSDDGELAFPKKVR